jgi:hypothetical protein
MTTQSEAIFSMNQLDALIPNFGHDQNSICIAYDFGFTFAPSKSKKGNASVSFGFLNLDVLSIKYNTPPMPLLDAHLGGLFFLGHE